MITADQVMALFLAAVPSFNPTWQLIKDEHEDPGYIEGRLHYLDAAAAARHLVALLERGETAEVAAGFGVIEELHLDGDEYVRELATIGYLEDVQNFAARSKTVTPRSFAPFLGTESARWWRGLDALWGGIAPPPTRPIDL